MTDKIFSPLEGVRDHFFNIKPFWLLKIARWNTFVIVVRANVAVNKQFWTFDVQANYGSTLLANLYGSWRRLCQDLKMSEGFLFLLSEPFISYCPYLKSVFSCNYYPQDALESNIQKMDIMFLSFL